MLIIWAAMQVMPIMYYFMLNTPPAEDAPPADNTLGWIMIGGSLVVATFVRWFVLPKASNQQAQLVNLIIGVALAEATMFYALFLMEGVAEVGLIVSMLGIAQFCPFTFGEPGESEKNPFRQQ